MANWNWLRPLRKLLIFIVACNSRYSLKESSGNRISGSFHETLRGHFHLPVTSRGTATTITRYCTVYFFSKAAHGCNRKRVCKARKGKYNYWKLQNACLKYSYLIILLCQFYPTQLLFIECRSVSVFSEIRCN